MSRSCRKQRSAFTLIELLVVVAIIALLISILLPSLSQAKEQAKIAKCLSNLRSLMQATNLYLQEFNDCFPFQVNVQSGGRGVCSWSYGGKTNDPYWKSTANAALHYHKVVNRPMNPYILGSTPEPDLEDASGNITKATQVPVLECPADKRSWQRSFSNPAAYPDGVANSSYNEVGTSYHFNLACYIRGNSLTSVTDVRKAGISNMDTWVWYNDGWTIMVRDAMRDAMYKHPSTFTVFWEDQFDWGISEMPTGMQIMGTHKKWSKHSFGFMDGHAANMQVDSRRYCGPGWAVLNEEWIKWPNQARGEYWYVNNRWRCCNPFDGAPCPP